MIKYKGTASNTVRMRIARLTVDSESVLQDPNRPCILASISPKSDFYFQGLLTHRMHSQAFRQNFTMQWVTKRAETNK